jgi:small conductance mechanosensitive channel
MLLYIHLGHTLTTMTKALSINILAILVLILTNISVKIILEGPIADSIAFAVFSLTAAYLVYFLNFIYLAIEKKLIASQKKNQISKFSVIVVKKLRLPLNIVSISYLVLEFITHIFATQIYNMGMDSNILTFKIFLYYGYIALISYVLYASTIQFERDKIKRLEKKVRGMDNDDDKLNTIKYELTILHGVYRFTKFIILIAVLVSVTKLAGIESSTILAFGSVMIVVIGMSTRYFLANIWGGFMILFYRPFHIGDKIAIPDKGIAGIVNAIGWLTVKIKDSSKNTTHIPNSLFSLSHVVNESEKYANRFSESFDIDISCIGGIGKKVKDIKSLLKDHNGVSEDNTILVAVDSINGKTFILKVKCSAHPTSEGSYSTIKQDILLKLFAFFNENEIRLHVGADSKDANIPQSEGVMLS